VDYSSTKEESEVNDVEFLGWPVPSALEEIAKRLNGNISYYSTLDHSGRTSNKIIIEYNVQHKEK